MLCPQFETTAERIKAVDLAAAMVEEMLKQAKINSGVKVFLNLADVESCTIESSVTNSVTVIPQVDHLLSTCVFLGFELDPAVNIVSRIRGPNVSFSYIHLFHIHFVSSFAVHFLCYVVTILCCYVLCMCFFPFVLSRFHVCLLLIFGEK